MNNNTYPPRAPITYQIGPAIYNLSRLPIWLTPTVNIPAPMNTPFHAVEAIRDGQMVIALRPAARNLLHEIIEDKHKYIRLTTSKKNPKVD